MTAMIPATRKKLEMGGNGGVLAPLRDFPALIRRMRSDFDELFDRFSRTWPMPLEDLGRGWSWGMDYEDKDDSVVLRAEAPGFEAGDFDLRISGDRLILRASRRIETKEKGVEHREESKCFESMTLPAGIDPDKIDARYHSGVLTITIPKTKEGRGKKIAVKNA
ncbi:MAG: Hsp20/alpha crystallin family protein [Planctomycetia bacterium]|nr:Hsp20/alpha crystallin family protein [Planctomycetia bacterium]